MKKRLIAAAAVSLLAAAAFASTGPSITLAGPSEFGSGTSARGNDWEIGFGTSARGNDWEIGSGTSAHGNDWE